MEDRRGLPLAELLRSFSLISSHRPAPYMASRMCNIAVRICSWNCTAQNSAASIHETIEWTVAYYHVVCVSKNQNLSMILSYAMVGKKMLSKWGTKNPQSNKRTFSVRSLEHACESMRLLRLLFSISHILVLYAWIRTRIGVISSVTGLLTFVTCFLPWFGMISFVIARIWNRYMTLVITSLREFESVYFHDRFPSLQIRLIHRISRNNDNQESVAIKMTALRLLIFWSCLCTFLYCKKFNTNINVIHFFLKGTSIMRHSNAYCVTYRPTGDVSSRYQKFWLFSSLFSEFSATFSLLRIQQSAQSMHICYFNIGSF